MAKATRRRGAHSAVGSTNTDESEQGGIIQTTGIITLRLLLVKLWFSRCSFQGFRPGSLFSQTNHRE